MKRIILAALAGAFVSCGGGVEGEKTFSYAGGEHQTGRIEYKENPPVGGPHNPVWQNCGVYAAPLNDEYAVHSLEHGAVWITYRPDLPAADVDKLKALVDGRSYTLLSPRPDLPSPVVASAWNRQVAVDSAGDARLKAFLDKYEGGTQAPERGAACSGGYAETR